MQVNDIIEHKNKIIDAIKDNSFSSEFFKKIR